MNIEIHHLSQPMMAFMKLIVDLLRQQICLLNDLCLASVTNFLNDLCLQKWEDPGRFSNGQNATMSTNSHDHFNIVSHEDLAYNFINTGLQLVCAVCEGLDWLFILNPVGLQTGKKTFIQLTAVELSFCCCFCSIVAPRRTTLRQNLTSRMQTMSW